MNNRYNIFISYCHQEPDSPLAHTFAKALEEHGHKVFIDTGIRWGANWVKTIRKALESTDFLLLLLSAESAKSEMVVEEVTIAKELSRQNNGRPILLPLRICFPFNKSLPYDLSAYLRNIQQEIWNGKSDTDRIVMHLLRTISGNSKWMSDKSTDLREFGYNEQGPQRQFDPRSLIVPGGAIDVDSHFYIVREADEQILHNLNSSRVMITIRSPRQTGKTSMIMRCYAGLKYKKKSIRPVFIDFQMIPHSEFKSVSSIWKAITFIISEQLTLENWQRNQWKSQGNFDNNLSSFFNSEIFSLNESPLLLCIDEIDRIFSSPANVDFFASIRSFYNRGAYDPLWKKVKWLLSTSSEPSFFIDDLTQSPFNIGIRLELEPFNIDQIKEFAFYLGIALDMDTLQTIKSFTGGRPYLVHVLLYHFAQNINSKIDLFNIRTAATGIFHDHLHRYLIQFQRNASLTKAMKSVLNGKGCKDAKLADRLEAAGLVRRDENQKIVPFCKLYDEFFKKELI